MYAMKWAPGLGCVGCGQAERFVQGAQISFLIYDFDKYQYGPY